MQFSYFGSVVLKVRFKQHLLLPAEQKRPSNIASPKVIDKIPPPLIALITSGGRKRIKLQNIRRRQNLFSPRISGGGETTLPKAVNLIYLGMKRVHKTREAEEKNLAKSAQNVFPSKRPRQQGHIFSNQVTYVGGGRAQQASDLFH